ncbi:MAG: PAS domain S-box protein, partial [Rhodocyclaceae bacterium]|nr:PAS domain S-box protein [Rhodocyclaceae bacterium]
MSGLTTMPPSGVTRVAQRFALGATLAAQGLGAYAQTSQQSGIGPQIAPSIISLISQVAPWLAGLLLMLVGVLWRANRQLKAASARADLITRELSASEAQFRSIFEKVDALAIQGYTIDGTVVYWNHASEIIYGFSPGEAIGASL